MKMSALTPAMKHFIGAERFAVVGRVLTDRSRYDSKVRLGIRPAGR